MQILSGHEVSIPMLLLSLQSNHVTSNNFVKAYETINDDLGYMSGKVDYSCDCVIKYPGLAKSTRNVSAPGAGVKQTEQQKAFHKLKVQTDQVPQFCRAWLDE